MYIKNMSFGWSLARDSGYLANAISYVTTNLFLNLDANTYVSGVTWNDLSGNSRNATLVNAPTYSSSQGGYFHFTDTSLQYAITPNVPSLSVWTLEAWYRPTKSLTGKVTSIASNEYNGTNLNYSLGNNNAPVNYNISGGFYNGAWRRTVGFAPSINTWYQGLVTYDGTTVIQYSNGVSQSSVAGVNPSVSGGAIRIARRWDETLVAANFFDGDISVVRVYSVALTPTQVLQNYNAVKDRYGLA